MSASNIILLKDFVHVTTEQVVFDIERARGAQRSAARGFTLMDYVIKNTWQVELFIGVDTYSYNWHFSRGKYFAYILLSTITLEMFS